jgi:hypothetical protein
VSKPSAELTRAIAQIQAHDFYAQDSASWEAIACVFA